MKLPPQGMAAEGNGRVTGLSMENITGRDNPADTVKDLVYKFAMPDDVEQDEERDSVGCAFVEGEPRVYVFGPYDFWWDAPAENELATGESASDKLVSVE